MPKISVVLLTYNKEWILKRCADSLVNQIKKADEVIVVDDASTDGTRKVIETLPKEWKRELLGKNLGQSHARTIGAGLAQGDLILFLDGDILMRSDMLLMMERALATNPNVSFVYCHYDRKGSRTDNVRSCPWDPAKLQGSNFVSMMTMIRRRDLPNPVFDVSLQRYEDWDLWIRMQKAGKRGMLVDQMLFTAYYNENDLSGTGESKPWYDRVRKKHGHGPA